MSNFSYIYTDLSELPVSEHETYLKEGFSGICTGGSAVVDTYMTAHRIVKNDLVILMPMQRASIREISGDFAMTFFKVDKPTLLEIMSSLGRITPAFFFYMRKNFHYRLKDLDVRRFMGFCRVLELRSGNETECFRKETILHLLRIFYWDLYVYYQKTTSRTSRLQPDSKKEKIASQFAMLVFEHYKTQRKITFYAEKLCISPVYLTKVIKEMNGQPPYELIAAQILVDVKRLLRDPAFDIKMIACQTGFANQSSMSRFFRKHTGISPLEYRRTVHIL